MSLFSCSYSLWYRRACPQPPQPHLPSPECTPSPTLTATAATLSSDTTTYSFEGSGANDPLPYTTYEFLVGTANSEGSVNSSFSEPDTATLQSGKLTLSHPVLHYTLIGYFPACR